jgi:hypothetical protein
MQHNGVLVDRHSNVSIHRRTGGNCNPGHPAHRTTTITTSGPQSTTTAATTFCVPEAPRDAGLGAVGEDVVYHDADDEVAGLDTVEENLMQPRRT